MSDRNKTLIVVEGKHEKNTLVHLLINCFPELPIELRNVHIFAADIYDLYHDIEDEYGELWYKENLDINIPLLISKRKNIVPVLNKNNYTNIILAFDYERQDPSFSQKKIQRMQEHFCNISEDGILYINYPMIEAYLDMPSIPDDSYYNKKIQNILYPGRVYKEKVRSNSELNKYIDVYKNVLDSVLKGSLTLNDDDIFEIMRHIFGIKHDVMLESNLEKCLTSFGIPDKNVDRLKYSIAAQLRKLDILSNGFSFGEVVRKYLVYIVQENIKKAWCLYGNNDKRNNNYVFMADNLDYNAILEVQGKVSSDVNNGYIWILCTFLFFCNEYKFFRKLLVNNEL